MSSDEGVKQPVSAHWFWGALLRNRTLYYRVALAAILTNMFALTTSLFTMTVYDRILPNNATESLVVLTLGVVLVIGFDYLIKMLRAFFIDAAAVRADRNIARVLFEHVSDMQLKERRGQTGAIASTMKEYESLRDFFASATLVALVDVPFIFLFITVIGLVGGPLFLVPLIAVPFVFLAGAVVQPILSRLSASMMMNRRHHHGVLVEALSAHETLKTTSMRHVFADRWAKSVDEASDYGRRSRMISQFTLNAAAMAQQMSQIAIVCFGVFLVKDQTITAGALIACVILTGRTLAPLGQLANLMTRFHMARQSYRSLSQIMKAELDTMPGQPLRRERFEGSIDFKNVIFSYPDTTARVLDNVSLSIKPGEKVAILGRIGSGKSTIARLMLGLYSPQEGNILIDNTEIRQIAPEDRRRNMGTVLQDNLLFSGSVRDNIMAGRDELSDEQVLNAARLSGTHEFMGKIPNGYDLQLRERGEGLSGGQRQSIALARAIVDDPAMLVLDEPTSAMDIRSEQAAIDNLRAVTKDRTLVLITHRMQMLSLVSRVIIIDGGKIVADGPRDEVVRKMQAPAGKAGAAGQAAVKPVVKPQTTRVRTTGVAGQSSIKTDDAPADDAPKDDTPKDEANG